MKSLFKLLILFAAFALGNAAKAQVAIPPSNLIVNNNTGISGGQTDFHFNPCATVTSPLVPYGSTADVSPCPTMNLVDVVVTFSDFTCSPVLVFSVALTPASPTYTYTDCAGNPITFTLTITPTDVIVDIN